MLICSLCIALIIVPLALLFGLPKEHAANRGKNRKINQFFCFS
jgi:hypothetical protein